MEMPEALGLKKYTSYPYANKSQSEKEQIVMLLQGKEL